MSFKNYSPFKLKNYDSRHQIFLCIFWVSTLLVLGKLIESVFFTKLSILDILRDLVIGLLLLATQIWILEKSKTTKTSSKSQQ